MSFTVKKLPVDDYGGAGEKAYDGSLRLVELQAD